MKLPRYKGISPILLRRRLHAGGRYGKLGDIGSQGKAPKCSCLPCCTQAGCLLSEACRPFLAHHDADKFVGCRMTELPLQGVKDSHLHLDIPGGLISRFVGLTSSIVMLSLSSYLSAMHTATLPARRFLPAKYNLRTLAIEEVCRKEDCFRREQNAMKDSTVLPRLAGPNKTRLPVTRTRA